MTVLERRLDYLSSVVAKDTDKRCHWARHEKAALQWALGVLGKVLDDEQRRLDDCA